MFFDQNFSQPREALSRMIINEKLIRVGATVVPDGYGFSTPDELRAASAKVLPSTNGQLGRSAIGSSIPAFHRMDREAIAYLDSVKGQRFGERRRTPRHNLLIAWD